MAACASLETYLEPAGAAFSVELRIKIQAGKEYVVVY